MIKNQRQYRVTRTQLRKFTKAAKSMESDKNRGNQHPLQVKAEMDALNSMREDLQGQLDEYDKLLVTKVSDMNLESALDLPLTLIKARISSGMSQKDLAKSIGVKEQQIQRYEATEYESVSMSRIGEIIRALGVSGEKMDEDSDIELAKFFKKLSDAGIDGDFVIKKILPPKLASQIMDGFEHPPYLAKRQIVEAVGRVFGFEAEQALRAGPLRIDMSSIRGVKFKKPGNMNEEKIRPYTVYVDRIAELVARVTKHLPRKRLSGDPLRIYNSLTNGNSPITLEGLVDYVWEMGIPVMTLDDSGMFHGAYFNKNNRHVIILKQRTRSPARWMFDLLHEFWHAVENSGEIFHMIPHERGEEKANSFAREALLGGGSQRLTEMCLGKARYRVPYLRKVIPRIAKQENVPAAVLANCMAYEMSRNGQDMWGIAANIGKTNSDPRTTVLDAFVEKSDFSSLDDSEMLLLQQALNYNGEAHI